MAVTRKQLAISVRFVELHVFFLMEAKPDASFTFPQVHFLNQHIHPSVDFVTAVSPAGLSPTEHLQPLQTALPLWLLRCGLGTAA